MFDLKFKKKDPRDYATYSYLSIIILAYCLDVEEEEIDFAGIQGDSWEKGLEGG